MEPFLVRNVLKQLLLRDTGVADERINSAAGFACRLNRPLDRVPVRAVRRKRECAGLRRKFVRLIFSRRIGERRRPALLAERTDARRTEPPVIKTEPIR